MVQTTSEFNYRDIKRDRDMVGRGEAGCGGVRPKMAVVFVVNTLPYRYITQKGFFEER